MSGEIEQALRAQFATVTDHPDKHVAMEAHGRVAMAMERAQLAEVEAVICAEIAGLSVRIGAKNLRTGTNRAQRLRQSYRTAAGLFPGVRDDVLGMRLLQAGWPIDVEAITQAITEGWWEPLDDQASILTGSEEAPRLTY